MMGRDFSAFGARFGMKAGELFREGMGVDERFTAGRFTFADFYPKETVKEPFFRTYEAVLDRDHGLVSVTGVGKTGKEREVRSSQVYRRAVEIYGEPTVMKMRNPREDSSAFCWHFSDVTIMIESVPAVDDVIIKLHYTAPDFPRLWKER